MPQELEAEFQQAAAFCFDALEYYERPDSEFAGASRVAKGGELELSYRDWRLLYALYKIATCMAPCPRPWRSVRLQQGWDAWQELSSMANMDTTLAKRCFVEAVAEIPGYMAFGSIVPEEEPCFLCGIGGRAKGLGTLLKSGEAITHSLADDEAQHSPAAASQSPTPWSEGGTAEAAARSRSFTSADLAVGG